MAADTITLPPGTDPALDYPRPALEAFVYRTLRVQVPGVSSWCYAAFQRPSPTGWLTEFSIQVDTRGTNKTAADARADNARRLICSLPWASWPGGVISSVDVIEAPFWLPDPDGAPRFVARYAVRVHPRPAEREGQR